ncbi:MAG: Gmad2 immunoglobulin-like domain-containing protein [Patescibacteria group bacterium]|nr:Gmad2 immunoglobulin-like domain-containing protein [Patescibacteria group bacterium]
MTRNPLLIAGYVLAGLCLVGIIVLGTIMLRCSAVQCYFGTTPPPLPSPTPSPLAVNNFLDCANAGYPIMESYPRQCKTPDGRSFTEDVGNAPELNELIYVDSPKPNAIVQSPLMVTGAARGNWYFEASFPVKLLDANGNVLVQTPAQAQSDWMTTEFVPFSVKLTFEAPTTTTGTLVLQKDNPSGLPQYDNALRVPIRFH